MNADTVHIKYIDPWRGNYYLCPNLHFSANKSDAANFIIKNDTETNISNGDLVYIMLDNGYITFDHQTQPHISPHLKFFSIISSSDSIKYNEPVLFIDSTGLILKYEWGIVPNSDFTPQSFPTLITSTSNDVNLANWLQLEPSSENNFFLLETPRNRSLFLILLLFVLSILIYINRKFI